MIKYKIFENELVKIKVDIVKFLFELTAILSGIAILAYVYTILVDFSSFTKHTIPFAFIVTIATFAISIWIHSHVNTKNINVLKFILIVLFTFILLFNILTTGTDRNTIIYLLLIINILSILALFDMKPAIIFFIVFSLIIISVNLLQNYNILRYPVNDSMSDFTDHLIMLGLVWIVLRIGMLTYIQIRKSYNEASKYSKYIQNLNKVLQDKYRAYKNETDNKINQFMNENESLIATGNMSKYLIHDLSNAMSNIDVDLEILKTQDSYNPETAKNIALKFQWIKNMLTQAKGIMSDKDSIEVFEVLPSINSVINFLEKNLINNDIRLKVYNFGNGNIIGNRTFFERIIFNLLNNAIDELSNITGIRKKITITLKKVNHFIVIEIKDNGRGISIKDFEKIFEAGYSTKDVSINLGVGLNFVKTTVENYFGGSVKVYSKKNQYTKFTLFFPEANKN